ncbi:hypothetical protein DACRYDRAFT_109752 [Dacryopinax primogenitus]|uniref:T6SS Phospholipase effector Tle1-like catalytic domain-containing protein n=1 Tax=Dacryopinax primogenitus (strain DJM 731) TaxID=1858805 RepID=M5G7A5_DACPD|nr:uncharacterized protein DACRYDRAFT_109752 [Dacryopinax primogenitus]EJT99647.1 hypothetical protein DACRYDRAFT_109752 [Dacryopinax primogenitus]
MTTRTSQPATYGLLQTGDKHGQVVVEDVALTDSPTVGSPTAIHPLPPPKQLILCFDGTSDLFDSANTNVVRLVSYPKKDDSMHQQVYYQAGIGTYIKSGWMMPFMVHLAKVFDMAVAWDICNHIMGGYTFLMQNYALGDKISIFGFSRGAYTARALAGLLENREGWNMSDGFKHTFCNEVEVDFLGVWDTVASVGLFRSKDLPFTASDHHIRVFRHAISLDERRCRLKANQWQEPYAPPNSNAPDEPGTLHPHSRTRRTKRSTSPCPYGTLPPGQSLAGSVDIGGGSWSTDVSDVWFAGGHGDVGGGCAKNVDLCAASRIPLAWMVREIVLSNTGITFDEAALSLDGISLPSPEFGPSILVKNPDGELNTRRVLAEENWVENLDKRYAEDINAPVGDQLKQAFYWWMLEMLPFTYRVPKSKKGPGNWKLSPRLTQFGSPRTLQGEKIRMHVSVQSRMKNSDYSPKVKYGNAQIEWVH